MINPKFTAEWRAHYEGVLENIKTNGRYQPSYKNTKFQRGWMLCNFIACTMSCCAPCCMYDTLCFTAEHCCGRACCPYGMYCLFGKTVMDNTYECTNRITPHTRVDVSRDVVIDVCKKYLIELDMCVIQRTVKAARMANEIREHLVYIIQQYLGHPALADDGDINKLRIMIENAAK